MLISLSLNVKLMIAPVCLTLVMGVVGAIGYTAMHSTTQQFGRLADESIPNINAAGEMFLAYR